MPKKTSPQNCVNEPTLVYEFGSGSEGYAEGLRFNEKGNLELWKGNGFKKDGLAIRECTPTQALRWLARCHDAASLIPEQRFNDEGLSRFYTLLLTGGPK